MADTAEQTLVTTLADPLANFSSLAEVVANAHVPPHELRQHLDGIKAIDTDTGFFGPYAKAAEVMVSARVRELEQRYTELRATWQENLDGLVASVKIEEVNPQTAVNILTTLRALEEALSDGFREEAFGDLMDEAVRVTTEAVAAHKLALADAAVMAVDPESIDMDSKLPVRLLETVYEHSKQMPITRNAVLGDEAKFAELQRRYPLWLKRQEELLEKRRREEEAEHEAAIERGVEARDEKEHRNRVHDAGMTAQQREARAARQHEAAADMYEIVRRVTEIAHVNEEDHEGQIDAQGLLELSIRCEAMVARVEGRVN